MKDEREAEKTKSAGVSGSPCSDTVRCGKGLSCCMWNSVTGTYASRGKCGAFCTTSIRIPSPGPAAVARRKKTFAPTIIITMTHKLPVKRGFNEADDDFWHNFNTNKHLRQEIAAEKQQEEATGTALQQQRLTKLEQLLQENAEKEAEETQHLMGVRCCAREGYVFAPNIHASTTHSCKGCTYNNNLKAHHCCELCARHPPCTDWEYTSESTCVLKQFRGVAGENEWKGQVFIPFNQSNVDWYHSAIRPISGTLTTQACPETLLEIEPLPTAAPTLPPKQNAISMP